MFLTKQAMCSWKKHESIETNIYGQNKEQISTESMWNKQIVNCDNDQASHNAEDEVYDFYYEKIKKDYIDDSDLNKRTKLKYSAYCNNVCASSIENTDTQERHNSSSLPKSWRRTRLSDKMLKKE